MLISSKDLEAILKRAESLSTPYPILYVRSELKRLEDIHLTDLNGLQPPVAVTIDTEQAMAVYLTPELYKFLEGLDNDQEVSLIDIGKLYLKIKPFLTEGRIRKASKA